MQTTLLGYYDLIPESLPAEGDIAMSIMPIDIITYWKRCGLMANFIAAFYTTHAINTAHTNLMSTVFNELLENATKYATKRDGQINIQLRMYHSVFKIHIENNTTEQHFYHFKSYLKSLLDDTDLESRYIEKLEQKSLNDNNSGMGLIMLLKDYPVKIGARLLECPEKNEYRIAVNAFYYMED